MREHLSLERPPIAAQTDSRSRGLRWFGALIEKPAARTEDKSILVGDVQWGRESIRAISVVCNPLARFPRAWQGQVGLEEGWEISQAIWDAIKSDEGKRGRAIVAIIDVPGQAFGWHEEALGIHLALAASVDAYVAARELGHPIVALIVGKAISGAFLAHGLQANEILALDDVGVEVHVMSEASVARVTRRGREQVAGLAHIVPSTARDVRSFAALGGKDVLVKVSNADAADLQSVESVREEILRAIERGRALANGTRTRLDSPAARTSRAMSRRVRRELESQWLTTLWECTILCGFRRMRNYFRSSSPHGLVMLSNESRSLWYGGPKPHLVLSPLV
jgi:malonate decarboxylase beta subunit